MPTIGSTSLIAPNDTDSVTVTITNGTSLSNAAQLGGARPVAILMPGTWTSADLTFQGSFDGTTYGNLYDASATEVTVTNAAATARYITLDPSKFASCVYLKVRSGTSGSAVNQGADRLIVIIAQRL